MKVACFATLPRQGARSACRRGKSTGSARSRTVRMIWPQTRLFHLEKQSPAQIAPICPRPHSWGGKHPRATCRDS